MVRIQSGAFGQVLVEIHEELVEAVIAEDPKRLARAIESHSPIADHWMDVPS